MIGVGIDFGTSNSTLAVCRDGNIEAVSLEQGSAIMPTATYIDRDFQTETGEAAIRRYVADNTGRTVELIPEVIGRASLLTGGGGGGGGDSRAAPETLTQTVYGAPVDAGLKGRLFRGVKRLLGDPDIRRLMVFHKPYRTVALITPVLLRMRKALRAEFGDEPFALRVGHPVNFEGRNRERNHLALTRLEEACGYAGWDQVEFYPEPVAATLSYMQVAPAQVEHVVAVDFGGGTLDLCLLRREGDQYRVLATHGIGLGGDHIDQALFRHCLFPLLGKGERWRRRGTDRDEIDTRFPFDEFEPMLLNWAVTYLLNQNRYTTPVLDCVDQGGPASIKFRRLRDFISHNLGYTVFASLKDLKVRLSAEERAQLVIDELDVNLEITRSDFEHICADQLQQLEQCVEQLLDKAAFPADRVDMVVRTGGSCLIPAVRNILERAFPGRVVEHDPFTGVARGLAVAAWRGERFSAESDLGSVREGRS